MNNKDLNRIKLELLIKELTTPEADVGKTNLKINLILDLINRPIKYVPVIPYYYDIK